VCLLSWVLLALFPWLPGGLGRLSWEQRVTTSLCCPKKQVRRDVVRKDRQTDRQSLPWVICGCQAV
jgi:hypothetical protein